MVKLHVQYVLEPRDAGEKRRRLRSLPTSPTEAYRGVLDRMTPNDLQFARRILGWVLYAQRILTMPELQEALAIEIGVPSLDRRDITSAEEIISTCGGFLNHDSDSDLVTFNHETVRPFLEKHESSLLSSHLVLSRTCLTYLRLPEFEEPCLATRYTERLEKFELSRYAARFWATHAVATERDVELETEILETFDSVGRREAMEQLKDLYRYRRNSLLHVLIDNRLFKIFMSPLLGGESIDRMWFCL
jgi:hypothetical protein